MRTKLFIVSIFGCVLLLRQVAFLDCLHLNLNSGFEVGFSPSEADVGGCQFFDALVVAIVVVIVEPSATCGFCIPACLTSALMGHFEAI